MKGKSKDMDPRLVPEVNIGTLGHVDHGKSTLVEAIAGKWPALHSEELKRGITIKLGYADATLYRCKKCNGISSTDKCPKDFEACDALRTISFVDAPGHETLMATVLAGASLMDGVLFIIAANEKCPQPQTREHLMSLDIAGIRNIIIVQNKIDLVTEEKAKENYKKIKELVKGTVAENAPIIPVSAQRKININAVLSAIEEFIPTPERDAEANPRMLVVRSFDINRPGADLKKLKGGVIGGSITQGKLKINDDIEIRPGIKLKNKWKIIRTKIKGLQKAGFDLKEAGAGGLLGLMTNLDPSLSKADSLIGSVVGLPDKLPPVLNSLSLETHIFKEIVGVDKVEPIKPSEPLLINVGTARTIGIVKSIKKVIDMDLKIPVCADKGERVAISRRMAERWRLIGWGIIK